MEDKNLTVMDGFRFGIGLFIAKILFIAILCVTIGLAFFFSNYEITLFTKKAKYESNVTTVI